MARETKTDTDAIIVQPLITQLSEAATSAELWKVGGTDEFRAAVEALTPTQQQILRDHFKACEIILKGKVKAEDVGAKWNVAKQMHEGGEVLRVMSWDYPPRSSKFPDSEFVVLKGSREDHNGEKFEMVSGAMRIVRHFKNIDPKDVPQRIMLMQETDDDIAARGGLRAGTQRMWSVKRLPSQTGRGPNATAGTPF